MKSLLDLICEKHTNIIAKNDMELIGMKCPQMKLFNIDTINKLEEKRITS